MEFILVVCSMNIFSLSPSAFVRVCRSFARAVCSFIYIKMILLPLNYAIVTEWCWMLLDKMILLLLIFDTHRDTHEHTYIW